MIISFFDKRNIIMDISNIYELSEEIQNKYKENPFPDEEVRPGMREFAEKFKKEILGLPTPYVMVLEGGYGVGKTYFITRFCEYLKQVRFNKDVPVASVYLNLWENDYVVDPFSVIVGCILSALNPADELRAAVKSKAIKITNNFIKFGLRVAGCDDVGDVLPDPSANKQDLKEFKAEMAKLVQANGGKVVLIVDEIDRCKPDYAVKALETIKHFFGIDGLFVILTTKLDFMDSICEAYYGKPDCKMNMGEGYIQKFVQSKKILNPVSKEEYQFIVKGILNINSLPLRRTTNMGWPDTGGKANMREVEYFLETLIDVFYKSEFSIRKTMDVCREILFIIKQYHQDFWTDVVTTFPEFIIIKYLKAKGFIESHISEPEVQWSDPDFDIQNENFIKKVLDRLL